MTDNALTAEEKARSMRLDAVNFLTQPQGENRPTERAGIKMAEMTEGSSWAHVRMADKSVGCRVGLAPGTQVLTLDGAISVEFLNPGDRIITRRGVRTLKTVLRTKLPAGEPRVKVLANALGGKPSNDITLMPDQLVLVRDWRVQALWGGDIAAVPAARLVDDTFIHTVTDGPKTVLSLYFGAPEIFYAGGLELASADKPKVAATAA